MTKKHNQRHSDDQKLPLSAEEATGRFATNWRDALPRVRDALCPTAVTRERDPPEPLTNPDGYKPDEKEQELLTNIQTRLPELTSLLEKATSHWGYEDAIYRFYHQSFKVYSLQGQTQEIVGALRTIAPLGTTFCEIFTEICEAGAGSVRFEMTHNQTWTVHTRPFVEAFLHAKYFLEMAVKYGSTLKEPPSPLPSGWAALLCLYNLR